MEGKGTHDTEADEGMRRRVQGWEVEAGMWQVWITSRWIEFHARKRGGDQMWQIGDTTMTATDGGR